LRSGNSTNPTSYFNPNYSYQFDISGIGIVNFDGVPTSVQGPYTEWGGSHWGFMEATVNFSSGGPKTLGITAKYVWQAVDYLEIIEENGSSVCEGNITLSSQAEVDACHCTEVTGSLTISGNDITNLNGLSSLKSIGIEPYGSMYIRGLSISDNDALTHLDGLSSLTSDMPIDIINNQALTNIDGLSSITQTTNIHIDNNDALTNIDGLSSITQASMITILNNDALTNIDGLSSITQTWGITINNNDALTNIDGLTSVTSAGDILIGNNNLLENINGLSSLATVQGYLEISNNNSLPNLDGLYPLKTIGIANYPFNVGEGLIISGNDVLTNIDGLSSLTSIEGRTGITGNYCLKTLDGLSSLTSVGDDVTITDNPSLIRCCGLFPLLDAGGVSGSIDISNNGAGCTEADILDGGSCDDRPITKIEIENNYSKVSDVGTNGAIKIRSFSINSNGKAVAIPDKGDKINVSFNIPSAGQYKLKVWLRSGNATIPTSYFNPDYSYQFDISGIGDVKFIGVPLSVQGPFSEWGGSHWGLMEATVNFSSSGTKTLGIMAKYVWQAVDYLEIIQDDGCVVCEGDITLSSQTEVDAFNCNVVTGNLIISGSDITNLDGLASIRFIDGSLTISNNSSLTNLDGLSSLKTIVGEWSWYFAIGGLSISDNDVLTNLDGLSSLVNSVIPIPIDITNNQALTNIDGLSSITKTGNIYIENNKALTNIDGLSSITSVGNIHIRNNNLLENINGLSSLNEIPFIAISNNNSLPNLDGLSSLKAIGCIAERYPSGCFDALIIRDNDVLTNINGLSSLTNIDCGILISGNDNLVTLDGLSSLTSVGIDLVVQDNPALVRCCGLFPLLNAGGVGGIIDISNNGASCTEADILEGGPCDDQTTTKIEIEDNYSKVSDVGSNGAIKIRSFSINSNGKAVAIPDMGDKINVAFNIPSAGQYQLRVWLRSGNATMPTSYFNPDYSYQFDISGIGDVKFIGVPLSVQGPFTAWGGSHWGFMEATVNFSSGGAKTLSIMAKYVWQAVDYLEIIPLGSSARIADFTIDNKVRLKDKDILHIYPNPTKQKYHLELKNASEGPAKLVMYDLNGRKALMHDFSVNGLSEHQIIDVSHLNKGFYILNLTTSDHLVFMDRIVIE
jgi:hypothetical protein